MSKRKQVSKKVRFEVFKRDSFTCQYCGKSAPDVVLEVDHIKPVANNGSNDIFNLITSCMECNNGKGARELTDRQEIHKQMEDMKVLSERRNQLDMLVRWREELRGLEDAEINAVESIYTQEMDSTLNGYGRQQIRKAIAKHGLALIMESAETACSVYLERDEYGDITDESKNKAIAMTARIAAVKEQKKNEPYLLELFYCCGILKRRMAYCGRPAAIETFKRALAAGATTEELKDLCCTARSWREIVATLEEDYGVVI